MNRHARLAAKTLPFILPILFFLTLYFVLAASPSITSVTLNSSYGYNTTLEDIQAFPYNATDSDGDNISFVYDWRLEDTSIAVLNMNFDVNNSGAAGVTEDYSTHNNDGSIDSATWCASCGWNGTGAYQFDGIDDNITMGDPAEMTVATYISVEAWAKPYTSSNSDRPMIFSRGEATFLYYNNSHIIWRVRNAASTTVSSVYPVTEGEWVHAIGTYNGSDVVLYIDGQLVDSDPHSGVIRDTAGYDDPNLIGAQNAWHSGSNYYPDHFFNGTIDNVRVYNRTLTADEAAELYANHNKVLDSDETSVSDSWTVCVTPNDGSGDGTERCSSSLTIASSSPPFTTSLVLNSTSGYNTTTENLTVWVSVSDADDTPSLLYDWHLNDTSIAVLNMNFDVNNSGGSGKTKDYTTFSNNGTVTNAYWNATGGFNGTSAFTFGSGDYINAGSDASLDDMQDFSISFWMRPTGWGESGHGRVVDKRAAVTSEGFSMWMSDSHATFGDDTITLFIDYDTDAYAATENGSISLNSWMHVVATHNATSKEIKIYLNGTEANYGNKVNGSGSKKSDGTKPLYIGNTNENDRAFSGNLDSLQIWNRTLSAAQASSLFKNRSDIIASDETSVSDNWSVCVTPNDGTSDGTETCSGTLNVITDNPNVASVILNSTSGSNLSSDNLTAWPQSITDGDGDNVSLLYDWRLEDTSIAVLNMNFDVNNSAGSGKTKDYSTWSNNGTLGTTTAEPTWQATSGWNSSGVLEFDGGDYISVSSTDELNITDELTIALWINPDTYGTDFGGTNYGRMVRKGDNYDFYLIDGGGQTETMRLWNGGSCYADANSITLNTWQYVAVTYNGSHTQFYVNGVDEGSCNLGISMTAETTDLIIGNYDTGSTARYFDGHMDNILIINRSLSQEQIQTLYNNQTNILVSNETSIGDNWSVCVTPNDGTVDGSEVCSNELEIQEAIGAVINSLSTSPNPQGYYENITITANITHEEGQEQITNVDVGITPQGGSEINYTMTNISSDTWVYTYHNWTNGTYSYTIYATAGVITSNTSNFTLQTDVDAYVKTLRDEYHTYYNPYTEEYILGEEVQLFKASDLDNLTYRITVELSNTSAGTSYQAADVVWVIDGSGSMGDDQQNVADNADIFAQRLEERGVDYQLGVVGFLGKTDPRNTYKGTSHSWPMSTAGAKDTPLAGTADWTTNVTEFGDMVIAVQEYGGIENGLQALNETLSHFTFRSDAKKFFILLTDEDDDMYNGSVSQLGESYLNDINDDLKSAGVTVFVVSYPSQFPEYTGDNGVSSKSGGTVYDIFQNFSEVESDIGTQIAQGGQMRTSWMNGSYLFGEWLNQTNKTVKELLEENSGESESDIPSDLFTNSSYNITGFGIVIEEARDADNTSLKSLVSWKFANQSTDDALNTSNTSAVENATIWLKYPNSITGFDNSLSVNTSGYLYMAVQNWTGSTWNTVHIVVNETSTRQVPADDALVIRDIWATNPFDTDGNPEGQYRAYIALQELDGTVLLNEDGTSMNATYEFNVTKVNTSCHTVYITSDTTWSQDTVACENVYISNGATLTFGTGVSLTADNVYVNESSRISGDVNITAYNLVIESGSSIYVQELGYSGGGRNQDGNGPGKSINTGGSAPGASHGGIGGEDNSAESGGTPYGDFARPHQLGSGAAGGDGGLGSPNGGDGGGRIYLNITQVLNVTGSIDADGGNGADYFGLAGGGGAGGSIWIIAGNITGSGAIVARGGNDGATNAGGGGGGRIALWYDNFFHTGTVSARGGEGYMDGGAGTLYYKQTGQPGVIAVNNDPYTTTQNDLYTWINGSESVETLNLSWGSVYSDGVLNADRIFAYTSTSYINETVYATNVTVLSGGTLYVNSINATFVNVSGTLLHFDNAASQTYTLEINTTNLIVPTGGSIDLDYIGYDGGGNDQDGNGPGAGQDDGGSRGSGAGHGGMGASNSEGDPMGVAYGDYARPLTLGSGGGGGSTTIGTARGGNGGGALKINASGTVNVTGSILARGENGVHGFSAGQDGGGGAGGSIWIIADTIAGGGNINAIGGNAASNGAGGGGGGRVALWYTTKTFSGNVYTYGGEEGGSTSYDAAPGTYYENFGSTSRLRIDDATRTYTYAGPKTYINGSKSLDLLNITNAGIFADSTITATTINIVADTIYANDTLNPTTLNILSGATLSLGAPLLATTVNVAGTLTHYDEDDSGTPDYLVNVTATDMTVESGGTVNVDYAGYYGQQSGGQNGRGPGAGVYSTSDDGSGAGHGGFGGEDDEGDAGGNPYGSLLQPITHGSSGASSATGVYPGTGGDGGGVIFLNISDTLTVTGTIHSSGESAAPGYNTDQCGGAGAGGSIWIITDTLAGAGNIYASGGASLGQVQGGGGSGGRISLNYKTSTHSGSVTTNGGNGYSTAGDGAAGTIFRCEETSTLSCPGTNGTINLSTTFERNYTVNVSRALWGTWNKTFVTWNESASLSTENATYNISGLNLSTTFYVNRNRVVTQSADSDANGYFNFTEGIGSTYEFIISTSPYNQAPTMTGVQLTSTSGENVTSDNLTATPQGLSDSDGDNISLLYDWRLDNISIAVVNMNFDVNDSAGSGETKDYSTYSNNGTVSVVSWSATAGRNNTGAYAFNEDGYINASQLNGTFSNEFTLSLWTKLDDLLADYSPLSDYGASLSESWFQLWMDKDGAAQGYNIDLYNSSGGYIRTSIDANNAVVGEWQHVLVTWNGSRLTLYIDNVEDEYTTQNGFQMNGPQGNFLIGANGGTQKLFKGDIDDVMIFNYSLSATQRQALFNNQTNLIVSDETTDGDNWSVCVTPNDGSDDGSEVCSNDVEILVDANNVPEVSLVIMNATDNPANTTAANLTAYVTASDADSDNISYAWDWRKENTSIAVLNMNFDVNDSAGSGKTKDYSTFSNNATLASSTAKPSWNATAGWNGTGAYVFDGNDYMTLPGDAELAVPDEFSLSLWFNSEDYDTSCCTHQGTVYSTYSADTPDVGFSVWVNNDAGNKRVGIRSREAAYSIWSGNDVWSVGTWHHLAVTNDGSSQKIYVDGSEVASDTQSWSFTQGVNPPQIGREDTAYYFNGTLDEIRLFNHSLSVEQVVVLFNNRSDLIVSQETSTGDNWSVCVTPNDGYDDGNLSCSNEVEIQPPATECSVDGECATGKGCYFDYCFSDHGVFILTNDTQNVSWIDSYGRMMIAGTASTSQGSCNGEFPIQAGGSTVGAITKQGNLCLTGTLSETQSLPLTAPVGGGLLFRNSTGANVGYVDTSGNMVLGLDLVESGFT